MVDTSGGHQILSRGSVNQENRQWRLTKDVTRKASKNELACTTMAITTHDK